MHGKHSMKFRKPVCNVSLGGARNVYKIQDGKTEGKHFKYKSLDVRIILKYYIGKYSFVTRTIRHCNRLQAQALATFPCKSHIFRKRFKK
jgi:hypothetical protein